MKKLVFYKGRPPAILGAVAIPVTDQEAALRQLLAERGFDFLLENQVFLWSHDRFVFKPYFKILAELFPEQCCAHTDKKPREKKSS